MPQDATTMPDLAGWKGSRRRLLTAAGGLALPFVASGCNVDISVERVERPAAPGTRTPQPTRSPLRDFAYVCAALALETQTRDDLRPLAGVRPEAGVLFLEPEPLVRISQAYSPDQAQRIFAAGAKQLYASLAASEDSSRVFVLNIVEGTTTEGADAILRLFRSNVQLAASDLASPALAPGADDAYLLSGSGVQAGVEEGAPQYHWLFCGLRFGRVVVGWQAGFRSETPAPALAGAVNRVLRDYLTDAGIATRRGASLAWLFTIPAQPTSIAVEQYILDGTLLRPGSMDEGDLARQQADVSGSGNVNAMGGSFRGPGRLAPNMFIEELANADRAREYFASFRRDQPANDRDLRVTRRPLSRDEFALTGWDDWAASAFAVDRDQYRSLSMGVEALLGAFRVVVEVGDDGVSADAVSAPPAKGDPALAAWSAMARRLLTPIPAAVRAAPDAAARAVFPPPLPAFPDPLAG